ncbi:uncharacterized protein BKCO1_7000044 [Diplodia corticola]|uniref:Uncharacterized protein n=1 Tax=Diplodia corticola TaxID=236234 RepID=A0A1J9QLW5_9PEZI|nr:uncharacterized protein BKCO1_7000044 [Diplodia corticola]OJD29894.1 hypothetical protein BKCO1_7000044 [Diplodia corticola]
MLRPRTKLEWAYFGITTAQAVVTMALQLTVLVNYLDWVHPWAYQVPLAYTFPISIAVFIAGTTYQAILTVDSFRLKSNIQIFAQCTANACLSISSTLQYDQLRHAAHQVATGRATTPADAPFAKARPFWTAGTNGLLIGSIAASFASTGAMCCLAAPLHREFSWALYKDLSADARTRSRYLAYQAYLVLIKLAFYFVFSFVAIYAFVDNAPHFARPAFGLTLAVIPLSLLTVAVAVYSTRAEARAGMALTVALYLAAVAWLLSRMAVLVCGGAEAEVPVMRNEQLLFVVAAVVFLLAATAAAVRCLLNFGKGLKPILLGQARRKLGPTAGAGAGAGAAGAAGPSSSINGSNRVESEEYYFQRLNHGSSTLDLNGRFELD